MAVRAVLVGQEGGHDSVARSTVECVGPVGGKDDRVVSVKIE